MKSIEIDWMMLKLVINFIPMIHANASKQEIYLDKAIVAARVFEIRTFGGFPGNGVVHYNFTFTFILKCIRYVEVLIQRLPVRLGMKT